MGLLGKLFGAKSAEQHAAKGAKLFQGGDYGGAKLAFERAVAAADSEQERDTYTVRMNESRDAIGRARLDEAERLLDQGDRELAVEELFGALEVAASPQVRQEIQDVIDELESGDAIERATAQAEIGDEEQWAIIVGRWEDAQSEELESYGEPLRNALLALHGGNAESALHAVEAILDDAEAPRFLWGEVARARLASGDDEGAREALEELVDSLAAEEIGEVWLGAKITLARLADEAGDFEEAMAHYERAIEVFDDDYRPFFAMGRFLREEQHTAEAIEVLEAANGLLDDMGPDWQVLEELGLAYADGDRAGQAIITLEQVIGYFTDRKVLSFPPRTTRRLAELHEAEGKLERAADLYAALTRGADVENHAEYHREAARLLDELDLPAEAERMRKRAEALEAQAKHAQPDGEHGDGEHRDGNHRDGEQRDEEQRDGEQRVEKRRDEEQRDESVSGLSPSTSSTGVGGAAAVDPQPDADTR